MNLPSAVEVETDEAGLPVAVQRFGGSAVRHDDVPTHRSGAGDERQGTAGKGAERGATPPSRREVREVLELWRVEDEWWRAPINRRYVEVVLEGGAHVVLYEDERTHEWFMQRP